MNLDTAIWTIVLVVLLGVMVWSWKHNGWIK